MRPAIRIEAGLIPRSSVAEIVIVHSKDIEPHTTMYARHLALPPAMGPHARHVTTRRNVLADGVVNFVAVLCVEASSSEAPHHVPMDERVVCVVKGQALLDPMFDRVSLENALGAVRQVVEM